MNTGQTAGLAAIGGVAGLTLGGALGGLFSNSSPSYDPASMRLGANSFDLFQQANGLLYPAQSMQIGYATNNQLPGLAAQQARTAAGQSFDAQNTARGRLFNLMGFTPTAAQQSSLNTQSDLARSAAVAQAGNTARQGTYGLQQSVLAGS